MPVESASYVNQLDPSLPSNTDPISEGDNHLRLIKQALKNTFPNVGGQVTLSDADLNNAAIRSAALTSGALVKADASGKLTSSYAEADVPRRNQAETITGGWTFDTGVTKFRDQGAAGSPIVEVVTDDQVPVALRIRNTLYGGNGLSIFQYDAGDVRLYLNDSANATTLTVTFKQSGALDVGGRLDAQTIYENNLRVLAQMNSGRLIGRTTAGAGQWEEISTGSGLSFSAGILDALARFTTVENGTLTNDAVYQNTTGRPMMITAAASFQQKGGITAYIGSSSPPSIAIGGGSSNLGSGSDSVTFIVPPSWYYKVSVTYLQGNVNFVRWY